AGLLEVLREHLVGELHAELPRGALRHLLGVDAVEVLAGRIRVGIADRLTARADRDEAPGERRGEAVELAYSRLRDARFHLLREHLRVVRQEAPVRLDDRRDGRRERLALRRRAEGVQA